MKQQAILHNNTSTNSMQIVVMFNFISRPPRQQVGEASTFVSPLACFPLPNENMFPSDAKITLFESKQELRATLNQSYHKQLNFIR